MDVEKLQNSDKFKKERAKIVEGLLVQKKDFAIFEILVSKKQGKVANIHKATLKGKEVICKVIELERITNYQIESFINQLTR